MSSTKAATIKVLQADKANLVAEARQVAAVRDNSARYEFVDSVELEGVFTAEETTRTVREGENAGQDIPGVLFNADGIAPLHWRTEITGPITRNRMATLDKLLAKAGKKTKFYLVKEMHKDTKKVRFQLAI